MPSWDWLLVAHLGPSAGELSCHIMDSGLSKRSLVSWRHRPLTYDRLLAQLGTPARLAWLLVVSALTKLLDEAGSLEQFLEAAQSCSDRLSLVDTHPKRHESSFNFPAGEQHSLLPERSGLGKTSSLLQGVNRDPDTFYGVFTGQSNRLDVELALPIPWFGESLTINSFYEALHPARPIIESSSPVLLVIWLSSEEKGHVDLTSALFIMRIRVAIKLIKPGCR